MTNESAPPLSTRHQLELMRDLQRLARHRQAEEEAIKQAYDGAVASAKRRHHNETKAAESAYQERKQQAESHRNTTRERLESEYEAARTDTQQAYHGLRSAAESDRKQTGEAALRRQRDEAMVILSAFDAQKDRPRMKQVEVVESLKKRLADLAAIERDAAEILAMRGVQPDAGFGDDPALTPIEGDAVDDVLVNVQPERSIEGTDASVAAATKQLDAAINATRELAQQLYQQSGAWLIQGAAPVGVALAVGAVMLVGAGLAFGWTSVLPYAIASAAMLLTGAGLWLAVRPNLARRSRELHLQVAEEARGARLRAESAAAEAQARSRHEAQSLIAARDADLAKLGVELEQFVGDVQKRTKEQLKSASQEFPNRLAELRATHDAAIGELETQFKQRLAELIAERDRSLADAADTQQTALQHAQEQRYLAFEKLQAEWTAGYRDISAAFAAMRERCDRLFPDWRTTDYAAWDKPDDVTMAVEFGRATLDLGTIKHGLSSDERLRPEQTTFELPTLVTLRDQPALVVAAEGAARRQSQDLLQAMMLRWITAQPPGKTRFTVLDPVGLGEGFSSVMHLADYDENLIATRIWSEPRDIDEQLARLTNHMETVIQKYLRSEYESIHEYNQQAGEVAEPFQVLVVNGFPNGFSDTAAQRLVNLATGGPRCGVYVMVAIDRKGRMPTDFAMDDLLEHAVYLDWDAGAGRFVWRYPAFERLSLTLASSPPGERLVDLFKQTGQASKDAVRVEVPFDVVTPDENDFWSRSCSDELRVPIGRAGANRLQEVRLGKGTSQHLLVAGKTGSGKSTFLHALVTSAAMHFSPEEIEFYLVDFKKGVEFKSYATHKLPHARVVAIESEREFGISVLERLDEELKRRGELYRDSGVQNLADFRVKHPGEPMPRVLLVIDEFQELFTEDDKLAQQATLLLDRLVRQGRAFGVHVLLGTQTLAGAYSIARSTLGQIAVRVALECSEADAHLILADERNNAARFLSRPGEAIYNDQNGLATANEPFQVVWLPDNERADRLAEVNAHREAKGMDVPPMIVFEGSAAADPAANAPLRKRIAESSNADCEPSASSLSPSAFLGDAVAIKPPMRVTFARHGGANLLVVGSEETAAIGMLSTAAISLAAADSDASFVILDGSRDGDASQGIWPKAAAAGRALTGKDSVTTADPRTIAEPLANLAAEVKRREDESDESAAPIYLVIHNAGRFRNLRRSEDDFGFSMDTDKPPSPDKHLGEILKQGPSVGVHILCWCDSYNAASRLFDRAAMREFAYRVVLPMSAADSSNLIDTPAAGNLSPHRALLYNDETGDIEKLRPYGLPSGEWFASFSS